MLSELIANGHPYPNKELMLYMNCSIGSISRYLRFLVDHGNIKRNCDSFLTEQGVWLTRRTIKIMAAGVTLLEKGEPLTAEGSPAVAPEQGPAC